MAAKDVANFINHHYSKLGRGHPVSDNEYHHRTIPERRLGSCGRSSNCGLGKNIKLTTDNILADAASPNYDVLAVILWEDLNKRQGLKPAVEKLTSPKGLSNLLTFAGTGQVLYPCKS